MAAPREAIVALCKKLVPETKEMSQYIHWHQIGFDHIAKDYGQGSGTTCGFLPHWLLWRFGCIDNTLVNRSSPPEGLTYRIGQNLSIFQPDDARKIKRPSWNALSNELKTREAASGRGPKPGDFVIIRGENWKDKDGNRTRDSAHIFVLLEVLSADGKEVKWRVAQSGVSNNAREQGAHITTLTGKLREEDMVEGLNTSKKGPHLVFIANILGEEPNFPRRVIGYVDLDQVAWGGVPSNSFTKLFEERWRTQTTNDVNKVNKWFGWYELDSPGGFIPLHPTYVLLHRGHEAFRLERKAVGPYSCAARGVWTLTGATVDVVWEDATPNQSWTMATTFVPKTRTEGTPVTANTGKLTRIFQIPPAKIPDGVMPLWRVD